MNRVARLIGLGVVGCTLVATGKAATDGTIGRTSSGTLTISMDLPEAVKIFNIKDNITLDWTRASTSAQKLESTLLPFTVYRNTDGGTYSIAFGSNNPGVKLNLVDTTDSSKTVDYEVSFYDNGNGTGAAKKVVTNQNDSVTKVGGATTDFNATAENASIRVSVSTTGGITTGTYNDTLTMTVRPD